MQYPPHTRIREFQLAPSKYSNAPGHGNTSWTYVLPKRSSQVAALCLHFSKDALYSEGKVRAFTLS